MTTESLAEPVAQPPTSAAGYLDTPTMGLPVAESVAALRAAVSDWASGRADHEMWERSMAECRRLYAGLMGASPAAVGLVPSVVPAFAAAAAAPYLAEGVVLAHKREYRSLLLPFLAAVGPDRVRWVDGPYHSSTFLDRLDGRVRAVIVSAVSSHDGARPRLASLRDACASVGARLVVDGTQAAGLVSPDVPPTELAAFACAGYKGLRGPRGCGYVVASDETLAGFAAPSGYGVTDAAERGQYGPPLRLKPGAAALDQPPSWLSWVGAEPALQHLSAEPAEHRARRVTDLAARLRSGLEELGWTPRDSELPSPMVAVPHPDAEGAVADLARHGVRAAARLGLVRFGLHTYNDEADVDLALAAFAAASPTTRPV